MSSRSLCRGECKAKPTATSAIKDGKAPNACRRCVEYCSPEFREKLKLEAAKKVDPWGEGKVTDDKIFVNQKLAEIWWPLISHAPKLANGFFLEAANFGTLSELMKLGIQSKNFDVPVPFSSKHHKRILASDEAKKLGISDVNIIPGYAYDALVEQGSKGVKYAFMHLDFVGSINGRTTGDGTMPRLDLHVAFSKRMFCSSNFPKSLLTITCCERNCSPLDGKPETLAEVGAVRVSSKLRTPDDRLPLICSAVTAVANVNGYNAHLCFFHTYKSMVVCGFQITENSLVPSLRAELASLKAELAAAKAPKAAKVSSSAKRFATADEIATSLSLPLATSACPLKRKPGRPRKHPIKPKAKAATKVKTKKVKADIDRSTDGGLDRFATACGVRISMGVYCDEPMADGSDHCIDHIEDSADSSDDDDSPVTKRLKVTD
jgi:hypothetical protein